MSVCLAIISYVCKGLCTKSMAARIKGGKAPDAGTVLQLLHGSVEMGVKALTACPADTDARSAVLTLLRTTLTVTDFAELIPWLIPALNAIIVSATQTVDADGIVELLELFGGFATRYKADIAPLISMAGLVEAIVDLSLRVAGPTEPEPEREVACAGAGGAAIAVAAAKAEDEAERLNDERRDARRIREALGYLMFWVTNTGFTAPFVSDTMKTRLPALLDAVLMACGTPPIEHPSCKNGFATLSRIVSAWLQAATEADAVAARPFLCDVLPRRCLQSLLRPELKLDKHGVEVVGFVGCMHRSIAAKYGEGFDLKLAELLTLLGIPVESDATAQGLALVQGNDDDAYASFLLELLRHSRDR